MLEMLDKLDLLYKLQYDLRKGNEIEIEIEWILLLIFLFQLMFMPMIVMKKLFERFLHRCILPTEILLATEMVQTELTDQLKLQEEEDKEMPEENNV